jgi:uncharacterized protein YxjI
VYDGFGNLLFYSKQKAFRLKEDFRIYSDERQLEELLTIKTPQILDIGATYHVQDATAGEPVGAVRRKGIKSILKDEWIFLDNEGREVGKLTESSVGRAILSRLINLIPQTYIIVSADGRKIAEIRQHFNPLILKFSMTIVEPEPSIDRRLLVSAGILLAGIERRQR